MNRPVEMVMVKPVPGLTVPTETGTPFHGGPQKVQRTAFVGRLLLEGSLELVKEKKDPKNPQTKD